MHLMLGYIVPSIVTVLIHVALLFFLSDTWHRDKPNRFVKPQMISARLVALEQLSPKTETKPKPRAAAPTIPPPKTEPKPEPKPKPKQEPTPKPDLVKQKADQERRERERREREQQAANQQLAAVLAQEEEFLAAKSQEEMAMSHIGAIQQAIAGRWSRPPSARRDMQVSLLINLIPTGEVVTVRVLDSSGNTAFDRSAINAVNKAARFPELANLPAPVFERYFRELRLEFRPEDLRL